jgi:hypothetical protein
VGCPYRVQHDISSAVKYLVVAIGVQQEDPWAADVWFKHAKQILVDNLSASMHIATVQGFTLVAVYMLRASQPNGAFLYFCKPRPCRIVPDQRCEALLTFDSFGCSHGICDWTASHRSKCFIWRVYASKKVRQA